MLGDGLETTLVMGLGYIGLPTAAVIARAGGSVMGVDICKDVVRQINAGRAPIQEADLDDLVKAEVARGRLRAGSVPEPADVFLIAVPTPLGPAQEADLSHVEAAARAIAPVLKPGCLILLESTCPVGTTEALRDLWAVARPDLRFPMAGQAAGDVAIAYCPERVLPGRILAELIDNDRCIGGVTPACANRALTFYRRFVRGNCVTTTARVAEMVKLAENSFRDVNIAFANELSLIAEHLGVDIWEVVRLANRHPRVNILQPGPGDGGHCIALDPWFLATAAPHLTPLIQAARRVNHAKTAHVVARAMQMVASSPEGMVAILGLAFKADVADFRESPALEIATALADRLGPRLQIVEPYAPALPQDLADRGAALVDLDTALRSCGTLVLLVDHAVFRTVPAAKRADKVIYDTRGLWGNTPSAVPTLNSSRRWAGG